MEDNQSEGISWIFSAEVLEHRTPSREHGISAALERQYRREGARFIINASNTLKLRRDTLATGAVFYHRFFMVQSFRDFDRWVAAGACMLLAGKVEETPKKCKDIIRVASTLLTPEQSKGYGPRPKEELIAYERVLLQTIRFDLQVDHPYSYLLDFAKHMKGEKVRIERVLQMAWTFINDSLCTTLCLQWEPSVVAVALLYLAGKLSKFDLHTAFQAKSRSWWRQFVATVDIHDLESICHQVLDVYSEEEKEQEAKAVENETAADKDVPAITAAVPTVTSSNAFPLPLPPPPLPPPPTLPFPQQTTFQPNTTPYLPVSSQTSQTGHSSLLLTSGTNQHTSPHVQIPGLTLPTGTIPLPPTSANPVMFQSVLGQPPQPLLPAGLYPPPIQLLSNALGTTHSSTPGSSQINPNQLTLFPAPPTNQQAPLYGANPLGIPPPPLPPTSSQLTSNYQQQPGSWR